MAVRVAEPLNEACAPHVHGCVLQPTAARLRDDEDDFRSVRFTQACCQSITDDGGTHILVLDVDPAARRRDGVLKEFFDLAPSLLPAMLGFGAGNGDADVSEIRLQRSRPWAGLGFRRAQSLAGGAPPAISRQLSQCRRAFALDRDLDVVVRRQKCSIDVNAPGVFRTMLRRIPTSPGEIETADKGHRVVDDDDLRMVRRADGMIAIHIKMNS